MNDLCMTKNHQRQSQDKDKQGKYLLNISQKNIANIAKTKSY